MTAETIPTVSVHAPTWPFPGPRVSPSVAALRDLSVGAYAQGVTHWIFAARDRAMADALDAVRAAAEVMKPGDLVFVSGTQGALVLWVKAVMPAALVVMAQAGAEGRR